MAEWREHVRDGRYLDDVVTWAEMIVAAILVMLVLFGTAELVHSVYRLVAGTFDFDAEEYLRVVDAALTIFVVVELFKIAVAYTRHEDVIPTVMEAALVAVARKIVVFDTHTAASAVLMKAGALALLLASIGIVWYALRRSGVRIAEGHGSSPGDPGPRRSGSFT